MKRIPGRPNARTRPRTRTAAGAEAPLARARRRRARPRSGAAAGGRPARVQLVRGRDEAGRVSTGGGTRRVQLVREGKGGGATTSWWTQLPVALRRGAGGGAGGRACSPRNFLALLRISLYRRCRSARRSFSRPPPRRSTPRALAPGGGASRAPARPPAARAAAPRLPARCASGEPRALSAPPRFTTRPDATPAAEDTLQRPSAGLVALSGLGYRTRLSPDRISVSPSLSREILFPLPGPPPSSRSTAGRWALIPRGRVLDR